VASCSKDKSKGKAAKAPTPAAGSAVENQTGSAAAPEGAKVEGPKAPETAKTNDKAGDPDSAKGSDDSAKTGKPAATAKTAAKDPAATKKGGKPDDGARGAQKAAIKPVVHTTKTHVVSVIPTPGSGGGSFTVKLEPKPGWKINQEFPTSLKIAAPAGVKLPKNKLRKGDAAKFGEKSATFKVNFSSDSGAKKFSAQFKFAMCTEATCDPKKEVLAFVVDVK
jgi:hypothetical protein